ncbi:MAG: peptidoglycan DD-metalloendopeptidase family protein [Desulfosarcina sp.]|nr:peptidoglycan DD-metalloendopeptidase family protein [Desulfosarcina sp.]MBC2745139.1 peptidoglycan DD-metalloendopeptidase family protein [Desulfosarcina sp.]MBC2768046.1 peptidoglycan DD-metalloendopeptidase family protein [Desulfosarcina sp.]
MYYPFLLYSRKVNHRPVFPRLEGDPFIADLSPNSPLLQGMDVRDQERFQRVLDEKMGSEYRWGVSPYLERRDTLLGDCPQMMADRRFIHLGLDVIVGLGTPLHAPLDATVAESGYESGEGNYGGYVLLKHESPYFETFFSFYGHLCKDRLPAVGKALPAGAAFAEIGDFHENGNWFYHTHIQVITQKGLDQGYVSKGYCAEADLAQMNDLCPSSIPLFKR